MILYFVWSQNDEAAADPQRMRRLRIWVIVTLALSFILSMAILTYIVTTVTKYLHER